MAEQGWFAARKCFRRHSSRDPQFRDRGARGPPPGATHIDQPQGERCGGIVFSASHDQPAGAAQPISRGNSAA